MIGTERDGIFVQDCQAQGKFNETNKKKPSEISPLVQVGEFQREYTSLRLLWSCVCLLFMYEYIDTELTLNVEEKEVIQK